MRVFAMLSGKPGSEIISELELRGATILYNFSLIDAIGIEIDDINKIRDLDFVSDVRESGKLKILLENAVTEIGALDVLNRGVYGEGIAIAVLDSGIISTPQLTYSLIAERDFTGEGVFDGVGHGTIVSKIIKANAPESLLINAKVCNSEGIADEMDTIKALEWVLSLNPDVINLSLGIFRDCDGTCPICRAVNAIPDAIAVVASGNEGPSENSINCPGNAKKALTVGAVHKDKIMDISSRGSKNKLKPDVVAPGKIEIGRFSVSGTSISTPFVSGSLALLLSVRNDKIKAVDSLKKTAEDLGFELWEQGAGKIRVDNALKIIKNPF